MRTFLKVKCYMEINDWAHWAHYQKSNSEPVLQGRGVMWHDIGRAAGVDYNWKKTNVDDEH